jgi:tetratricopeptide (TPR) repeat protein
VPLWSRFGRPHTKNQIIDNQIVMSKFIEEMIESVDTLEGDVHVWHSEVPPMTCDSCSKVESSTALKQCSACHLVWYCNSNCQKSHWKIHKPDCLRITDKKKSTDLFDRPRTQGPPTNSVKFLSRCSSSPSRDVLNLLKEAVLLIESIEWNNPRISLAERHAVLNMSNDRVKKILQDFDPDHAQALFLSAQILFFKGELNASIVALEELLDPQFGPPLVTDDEDKIMILTIIGKAYLKLKNFGAALPIYGQAWDVYDNACKCCMKTSCQKLILSGISQCSYELRDYEEAIDTGLKAIWFNRHYNESYEYVIRSYMRMNKWDMAAAWMRRALRYEAPWNEDIVQRNKLLSEELNASRDAYLARQALLKAVGSSSGSPRTNGASSSSSSSSSSNGGRHSRARNRTTLSSTLDI